MESLLASSEDHLLPHIDYKLGETASYIESRQEASFFSSVNVASPNGVRVLTFNVNSDVFLQLDSLVFSWQVNNLDAAKALLPLTQGAHGMIGRMLININGQPVEDIMYMNRLQEQFERVLPFDKRLNNADIGFGAATFPLAGDWTTTPIAPGGSRRVIFKPLLSGLLQGQNKLLPGFILGQQGLQIQLEL